MRRLIAIFVLVFLPLQWSYAAVADYCQHEETRSAQKHVGHHAHKHVGQSHDNQKSGGYGDQDCPTCHHTPLAIVVAAGETVTSAANIGIAFQSHVIPDRSPDNPYRPPHLAQA